MDIRTRTSQISAYPAVAQPRADDGPSRQPRDAFLDNAKALLIVLVVIGHSIETIRHTLAGGLLYDLIYSFHMPAFVAISGYLSSRFRATFRSYFKIVTTLVVPYLILQTLLAALTTLVDHKAFSWNPLEPAWTLWFLVAMAVWRASTPLLRRIPWVLPLSIVVSLGVGFLDPLPSLLAINRIVILLPFFVLGLVLQREQLEVIKQRAHAATGWIILAVLAVITIEIGDAMPAGALYYNASYAHLADSLSGGLSLRLLTFATGVAGTVAILAITPHHSRWWTYLGRWSMYIYLLHGLVIMTARSANLLSWPDSPLGILIIALAAVALAAVLASAPVRRLTQPIVQPPLEQLIESGKATPRSARGPSTSLDSTEAGTIHPMSEVMRARQSPVNPGQFR